MFILKSFENKGIESVEVPISLRIFGKGKNMNDYEACAKCGYDHEYESDKAHYTHIHCHICKQYLDDVDNCPDHECEES